MSNREQVLAIVLIALILLGVGGAGGYMLVYQPIQQKHAMADQLEADILKLDGEAGKQRRDLVRLGQIKRRSLPPDEELARREYAGMMVRLLNQANVPPGFSVTPISMRTSADRSIPQLAGKKPAYTKVVTAIEFRRADMWNVVDFLKAYYSLDILHQITHFTIERDEDPSTARTQTGDNRKDLTVKITSEAIILDGAEKRRTLLPVPDAFAAVGGVAGFGAIVVNPEIGRGITPIEFAPVLSTTNRDYSFIVLRDLFHGTLPKPPSLQIDRIANVNAEVGQDIPALKIPVRGGYGSISLAAKTDSELFPSGSLKLDETTRELTFIPAPGATGEATITVEAKSGTEVAKTEFRVTINAPADTGPPKHDISRNIRLVITGTNSEGVAIATIRDDFNHLNYQVEATRRRVKVTKYYYLNQTPKRDIDYVTPDELLISDDTSSTSRRFKVISVDAESLVLMDLNEAEKPPAKAPQPKGPPRLGPRPGAPKAASSPADPLEAVVGTAGVAVQPKQPVLYRWEVGKALSGLTPLPQVEARKLLERVALSGPVAPTAAVIEGDPNDGN